MNSRFLGSVGSFYQHLPEAFPLKRLPPGVTEKPFKNRVGQIKNGLVMAKFWPKREFIMLGYVCPHA